MAHGLEQTERGNEMFVAVYYFDGLTGNENEDNGLEAGKLLPLGPSVGKKWSKGRNRRILRIFAIGRPGR